MEASPEQRQRLIEAIWKRNHIRRRFGMPPLDIDLAYAKGLNRILRHNLHGDEHRGDAPRIAEPEPSLGKVINISDYQH